MNFLISIIVAILLVAVGRNFIKKHANICYIITAILAISLVVGSFTGVLYSLPSWFTLTILPLLMKSTFATALFVIVMYTGALRNGSKLIKYLMPIRAELSIIASILTLSHNITFGSHHFVNLFTAPQTMSINMICASIISMVMIAIMIPLFVTSFPKVRRLMDPKKWRSLQKLAYLFYGLTYLHVMMIMVPVAKTGNMAYIINVLVYSIVYLTYAGMRLVKYFNKRSFSKYIVASPVIASILGFVVVATLVFANPVEAVEDDETVVDSISEEIEEEEVIADEENEEVEEEEDKNTSATSSNSSSSSTVNNSSSTASSQTTTNSSSSSSSSSSGSSNNSSSNSASSSTNNSTSSSGSSSSNDSTSNSTPSSGSSNSGSSSNTGSSTGSDNSSSGSSSDSTSGGGSSSDDAVSGATQHSAE